MKDVSYHEGYVKGYFEGYSMGYCKGEVCDSTCLPIIHEAVGQEPVAHNFFLATIRTVMKKRAV